MTTPVKLYVYDLSNGLARQLSLQLTGKQIDGIWHTSVVVFEKEIFYGQGVCITPPGKSHHGSPLQVIDMGETAIDEETFNEYLEEIRMHYSADKYHLLEFNCNSFTNDCVGFLTGGSIPPWIKELPQEFLSTPFGQALRPTIDGMFRRTPTIPNGQPAPPITPQTSSLLGSIASQAQAPPSPQPPSMSTSTLTSPIHLATNLTSFTSLLSTHKCLVAFFSSESCPPCRVIEPAFERIARESASPNRVVFVKVDLGGGYGMGGSQAVAGQWQVRATPTFLMFLEGKKVAEVKGADAGELKTQVDLLLYEAFPPHPHVTKEYHAIRALSLNPILFTQIPTWDAAFSKLTSFIDSAKSSSTSSQAKDVLKNRVLPFLKGRFPPPSPKGDGPKVNGASPIKSVATPEMLDQWSMATVELVSHVLPAHEIFPLVDFWRVGLLDGDVTGWLVARAAGVAKKGLLEVILQKATSIVEQGEASSRNVLLTTLRLLCNGFGNALLARHLLDPVPLNAGGCFSPSRQQLTGLLISTLLHGDGLVRTAAASLAFNIAAHQQKPLVEAINDGRARRGESVADNAGEGQGDWEVEVVTAVVEAVRREDNEDVVHRLTAALGLFLHLSPYSSQLMEMLEVLGVKEMLEGKAKSAKRGEVRKLVKEVVEMCT